MWVFKLTTVGSYDGTISISSLFWLKGVDIQSALVISNSKGLSEIHRDTRTSTYQISKIEKKNLTTKYPKFIGHLTPLLKICIYKNYCGKGTLLLSLYVRIGTKISLRDKRLFEITEVEIARVDCTFSGRNLCFPSKIEEGIPFAARRNATLFKMASTLKGKSDRYYWKKFFHLTLKAPITTAADDIHKYVFIGFQRK